VSTGAVSFDALAANIVERSGYRFTEACTDHERDLAYRLRYLAVVEQGWTCETHIADGRERDRYDDDAVHIIAWDEGTAMATGRLVLPGPLPTEDLCGIRVEPRDQVVDIGRMTVARSQQHAGHGVFVALLARLYLEVRARGFDVACGMMSHRMRSLVRLLGVQLEILGDERLYWGELRAPVRFRVTVNAEALTTRWRPERTG
jgi:N-acyl-L-homoserine lactone synthetase